MGDQVSGFPARSRPDRAPQTVLGFVHPGAAARGPACQIRAQVILVSTWTGPLVVLQDVDSFPAMGPGAALRVALDTAVGVRKRVGSGCRVAPLPLAAAVVRLIEFGALRGDFLITGAGSAIAETARLLEEAGACVRVHPSAVTYDQGAT